MNLSYKLKICLELLEEFEITSLCPVLGKMYAQVYRGMCPWHTESPLQKEIKVSFFGTPPYITRNPMGGTDFTVTRLFAKKHGFIPEFIPAKTVDVVNSNGTKSGMFHQVKRSTGWPE